MADFSFIPTATAAFVASALVILAANRLYPNEPGLLEISLISLIAFSVVWLVIVRTTAAPKTNKEEA